MVTFYLNEKESRIVHLIAERGEMGLEELSQLTGYDQTALGSAVESLSNKNLILKHSLPYTEVVATQRALETVRLPEDQIYESMGTKSRFDELRSKVQLGEQEFSAGIAWGIKRSMFKMSSEASRRVLVKMDKKDSLSETFSKLKSAKAFSITGDLPRDVNILKDRQFAELRQRERIMVGPNPTVDYNRLSISVRAPVITHKDLVDGSYNSIILPEATFEYSPKPFYNRGKKHFYIEFLEMVKEILISMGFEEMFGPYIEYGFWNFDALFVPQNHPARDVQANYDLVMQNLQLGSNLPFDKVENVKLTHLNGWKTGSIGWREKWDMAAASRRVLRSHTTAVSVRRLSEIKTTEFRYFTIDRNFRRDAIDATHLPEFQQCEGILGGREVNLRHLFGILERFSKSLGVDKIRFKPGYFPFTEPSVEAYVYHDKLGWIEAAPGGIFRPEVTRPLGLDTPVLAWGIGITRFALVYYNISDIRELVTQDLDEILQKQEAKKKFANSTS
jgi:phenylalanyl-tRNA synthetase alpha chain